MKTKKLLVAYDESKPSAGNGDFLAIVFEGTTPTFFGLRSHRTCKFGRMVFIGKDVTAEDLFDRLLDSGRKIEAHDQTLTSLAMYVEQMASFKNREYCGHSPDG